MFLNKNVIYNIETNDNKCYFSVFLFKENRLNDQSDKKFVIKIQ